MVNKPVQRQNWRYNNISDREISHETSLVQEGIKALYGSEKYADCKFLVGTGDRKVLFQAHKLILAVASNVFEDLVYNHYTYKSAEPILVPDVKPKIFEMLLRYIYLNESPLESLGKDEKTDQILIIEMWYTTCKYGLCDLNKEFYNKIKIHLQNWFLIYVPAQTLLRGGHQESDVKTLISKCLKVFSVKTPEALCDEDFTANMPACFLKNLFALEHMNIESELDLFKVLIKYANENGWKPDDKYVLDKDENETKLTSLQKHIREAMKHIRFLSMTLKEFDGIPSKSGFFTEHEVQTIRKGIAEDSLNCASLAGFSNITDKKRYKIIHLKSIKHDKQEHKEIESLEFNIEFPESTLCITESFSIGNFNWRIIIYRRALMPRRFYEYSIYLRCDVPETLGWKCYGQLDIVINLSDGGKRFENIPWYCFKSDASYSQIKPIKLEDQVTMCRMELSISPHHVSYKNEKSNVSVTYGKDNHNYE